MTLNLGGNEIGVEGTLYLANLLQKNKVDESYY